MIHKNKSALIVTLKILQEYSDDNHHLTQNQIIDLLYEKYSLERERKALAKDIRILMDLEYDIMHDKDGYYLSARTFDKTEIRLLLDAIMTSSYIPRHNALELMDGLLKDQSRYFKNRYNYKKMLDQFPHVENSQIFHNIDMILEAIEQKKQILFYYSHYKSDKTLHKVQPNKYKKSPYQIFCKKGEYYLLCDITKQDNVDNFRLEFISEIEISEEPAAIKQIDVARYADEHLYMLRSEAVTVELKVATWIIEQIFDWMGFHVTIKKLNEEYSLVTAKVNREAIIYFAMQYMLWVEILSPPDIREAVQRFVELGCEKYLYPVGSYDTQFHRQIYEDIIIRNIRKD